MSKEPVLWSLLLCYAVASLTYSFLCGSSRYPPLSAYQVYALVIPIWYTLAACFYLLLRPHEKIRFWPPTRQEALSAVASTLILTSETLALLMPQSLITVVAGKGGCLAFPDPQDKRPWHQKLRLAFVALAAVALAALHKPPRWLAVPFLLAIVYVIGHRLKLRSVRMAKRDDAAKAGFFGAGQVLVIALTLCIAGSFHARSPAAALSETHLWLIAGASLCCGLLGLRLVLHRTAESIVFPAYRAASLCCALGASLARGEALGWSGWAAVVLALSVVLWASAGQQIRKAWQWVRVAWTMAVIEVGYRPSEV